MGIFNFWKTKTENRAEGVKEGVTAHEIEELLGSVEINRQLALEIPTVAGAINKIAGTIAKLPVRLYSLDKYGKKREDNTDIRPFLLSCDCGDTLDIANFWKAIIEDYYLGKGAYIYIDKVNNTVQSLRYVDGTFVRTSKNKDPIFKDFNIYVKNKCYYPFEFIKILRKSKDGAEGRSIIEENSKILSVCLETLKFEKKQVKRGGNKRGFFTSKHKLQEDALKSLKQNIKNLYNNSEDTDREVILNDGIEFKEAAATAMELQLNENKKTNADEICKIFGFPSTIINGNASEADIKLFIDEVVEVCNVIEAALDKDLLLESEKGSKFFSFDTRELTRGNLKERYEAYSIGLKSHFLQPDEVRALEDMEATGFNYISLGLGDVFYDPKTKEIFIPNTGQHGKLGEFKNQVKGGDNIEN